MTTDGGNDGIDGVAPASVPGLAAPDPETAASVMAADQAHVFHSWMAQGGPAPLAVAGAEGSWFWDYEGRRYLDFASQLIYTNLGHQHPKVIAAIREQAERLCTLQPAFSCEPRSEAARLICELAPGQLNHVFFTNGGAEAVENAARLARLHTGRPKVLAAYRSYHGATAGAISLTGESRRWSNDAVGYSAGGTVRFFGPYLYRSPFYAETDEEECERALAHLQQVIGMEGPSTIAAVIVESVPGSPGVLVPPDGYLAGVRALCDEYGLLMIADEVMCGFGRTGTWFAVDCWGVEPDLMTFAKGVNSGYVPLGGVLISDPVFETFRDWPYPGGLTYSGHPLACAAAVAAITAMRDEGVVDHAAWLGENVLGPGLREIAERHPCVGEVRGIGAFWALELVRDRETREMLVPYNASGEAARPMAELSAACRQRGVWPFLPGNRVHVAPPCNIEESEAKQGLAMLDDALSVADRYIRDGDVGLD